MTPASRASEYGNDLNRDGNPAGSSRLFGVIRDGERIWVDRDQDKSFRDETPMQEYAKKFDVQYLGTDNPATPVREAVPFVVQIGKATVGTTENTYVNIGIVSGAHGSHVAGIAAGNSLFGGAMSGAAPGAKLISTRACLFNTGCTNHALTEGMIRTWRMGADIINMSIGGLPALNDGFSARCDLYKRLIDTKNVQLVFSQGNNGPGVNTAGDPGVCSNVVAMGAYLSQASMRSNYGADTPYEDNLNYFSSLGPREDGGFKPQAVAPGSAVSTTPEWQAGGPVPGTYALPPGYSMFNGTSMASPQGVGAGALLLSAAKASGVAVRAAQLRKALLSTSRYLDPDRFGAMAQGNGILDVVKAWDILRVRPDTVEISATVPVNTVLSGFLTPPGVGTGIYDREGVTAGQAYSRTYTLTRTSGNANPITYNLSWVGNDGTFSTAGSVTLGLNTATPLEVDIDPDVGAHSAILNFDDPSSPGIEFQTMNTVLAPYEFTADNGFSQSVSGVGRSRPAAALLLPRAGRDAGVPRRSRDRGVHDAGHRPDQVPALASVRSRDRVECGVGVLRAARGGRLRGGRPAVADGHEPAGGCLGGHGRRTADVRRGLHAVHADRDDHRRDRLAEPGHHPDGGDRRAGRTLVHADERVRPVHGPGGRHRARKRSHRDADDRAPRTAAVPDGDPGRDDAVPGDDRQPVGPGADLDLFVFRCNPSCVLVGVRALTVTRRSRSR